MFSRAPQVCAVAVTVVRAARGPSQFRASRSVRRQRVHRGRRRRRERRAGDGRSRRAKDGIPDKRAGAVALIVRRAAWSVAPRRIVRGRATARSARRGRRCIASPIAGPAGIAAVVAVEQAAAAAGAGPDKAQSRRQERATLHHVLALRVELSERKRDGSSRRARDRREMPADACVVPARRGGHIAKEAAPRIEQFRKKLPQRSKMFQVSRYQASGKKIEANDDRSVRPPSCLTPDT